MRFYVRAANCEGASLQIQGPVCNQIYLKRMIQYERNKKQSNLTLTWCTIRLKFFMTIFYTKYHSLMIINFMNFV